MEGGHRDLVVTPFLADLHVDPKHHLGQMCVTVVILTYVSLNLFCMLKTR